MREDEKTAFPYEDIIGLAHHVSGTHPPMPLRDRAAQFSPFAALTGHGDAVKEAARLTEKRPELSEDRKEELDRSIRLLEKRMAERPYILVEWFCPDGRKEGGSCVTVRGRAERLDRYKKELVLIDGNRIPTEEICRLEIRENGAENAAEEPDDTVPFFG